MNENFIIILHRLTIMAVPFRILFLPALVLIATFISHASGAAVMSIDLGTEWMKVSDCRELSVSLTFDDFRLELFHRDCQWKLL